MRLLCTICLLLLHAYTRAQHPVTFFTAAEAASVKKDIAKYPLLSSSYNDIKKGVDEWIGKDIDVPLPKDAGGGYTHDRHKANYMLMFNSGLMYNLTGQVKYAQLVKDILLKYAALNPTLKKHPQATSSSPGRIFWQALNDANWLVYTGMAYDLTRNAFTPAERKAIEEGAFRPEVEFMTKDLNKWFDLIHNHSVWACAGVGIVGIATDNKEYVDMALYGTAKDGKSGFLAQMDNLFSPDGYYTEGPYYVRYAILPFYLFANALQHARPELNIFQHRQRILQRALYAGLQQTNSDGRFYPLNDAIREKDYTTNEMVTAIDIAWNMYGADDGLLYVAKQQNKVLLHKGGAAIAAAVARNGNSITKFPYRTTHFRDGVKGDEGGLSLLRSGNATLTYKYTAHGLSHGHFDKLTIGLFNDGNEVLTDYGSVRFVNIEEKYGGRYLPENDAYAAQTIAHNTVTVDETSHFNGNERLGEEHPAKMMYIFTDSSTTGVSARTDHAYKDVQLHRTIYMLQLAPGRQIVIDLFRILSPGTHQYDLPFHFSGQLINTSFKYTPFTKQQQTLGTKNGYQFLWKEAEAAVKDTLVQFTFLNGSTYYTISSQVQDSARLFLARTGANDPSFNMRHEPCFIIRRQGGAQVIVNVIEMHGGYDAISEVSSGSRPQVKQITVLRNDDQYTVASIRLGNKTLLLAQCNEESGAAKTHSLKIGDRQVVWGGMTTIKTLTD